LAIINKDNKNAVIVSNKVDCKKIYYSLFDPSADYSADEIHYIEGMPTFNVMSDGEKLAEITLNVRGEHNVSNSLAAFAAAREAGVEIDAIVKGLKTFAGTGRRFEFKGEVRGVKLYDDYAHHPTEIRTTFASAEALNSSGKTWYVFQPHTYTRTKALKEGFIEVLSNRKNMIIADIYAARENPIKDINSQNLARDCGAQYIEGGLDGIADFLRENTHEGDVVITFGAGDVYKILTKL
jgi:UDP-N-acetylmuramate--alanine ligase